MSLYPFVLDHVLHPLHDRLRGRNYSRYRALLERSQKWSRDQIADFQWQELSRLLDHAFAHVPYYRTKYAQAGIHRSDIRSMEDFSRLPMLGRDEIREHREELRADNVPGLRPHATGGSSGIPTRFYITMDSYDWRVAATDRAYGWSGCVHGELTLILWGGPIGTLPRWQQWKIALYNAVERRVIVNTFTQSSALWRHVYTLAQRRRPPLLVGYASSLDNFASWLAQSGLSWVPPRAIISAAEPLTGVVREHLQAVLRAPVFNTYGSREFMSIAAECPQHQGLHVNAENILIQTASSAPGASPDILVTDLHNYGMPFIRYQIGDTGTLDDTPCPCGCALPRIRSIDGRILDLFQRPDGQVVCGITLPHLMKEFGEVRTFQARQVALDHVIVSLVLSEPLSDAHERLMRSELSKFFGPLVQVELRQVDDIPPLASGKRPMTIGLRPQ